MRKLLAYPFRLVDTLLDRVLVSAGALALSQAPAFMGDYLVRLAGHVEEARLNIEAWRSIADRFTGGDIQALIAHCHASALPAVAATGDKLAADLARFDTLRAGYEAIRAAPAWSRMAVFARYADPAVARAALADFRPQLVLTWEALAYAAAGLILALALYELAKAAGRRAGRAVGRRMRRSLAVPAPGA